MKMQFSRGLQIKKSLLAPTFYTDWLDRAISKFSSRSLFKLFQNLSNRFQGVEIHEVHMLAVGGDEGADFGVALRFGDFRDLRIQKFHHDSVFQAESGVIDGAAKVEDFTFIVMRCGNLLL